MVPRCAGISLQVFSRVTAMSVNRALKPPVI